MGSDDIVSSRRIHKQQIALIPDLMVAKEKQLPTNVMIYCSITAYNRAGK